MERKTKSNLSVGKVFRIIEAMAQGPGAMRLHDIASAVRMPDSTALRLLNSLVDAGYVRQDGETLKYCLSLRFSLIGEAVRRQFRIREIAYPRLKVLAERCQESACLAIEEGGSVIYLDVVEGPDNLLRTLQRIGKTAPLHSTGVGKVLMADWSSSQLEELENTKGFKALTKKTITSLDKLASELVKVRRDGLAMDDEECELGARCVAAPLRDYSGKVVAGISVSGPASRMTAEHIRLCKAAIKETALGISVEMGWKPA